MSVLRFFRRFYRQPAYVVTVTTGTTSVTTYATWSG